MSIFDIDEKIKVKKYDEPNNYSNIITLKKFVNCRSKNVLVASEVCSNSCLRRALRNARTYVIHSEKTDCFAKKTLLKKSNILFILILIIYFNGLNIIK